MIFLVLVIALVVAALVGVRVVGVNEGQLGVSSTQGRLNEELLQPGIYIHVPRFRPVEVVSWGQMRALKFDLVGKNKNGEEFHQVIWLHWMVNSNKVVQFYRSTHKLGFRTNEEIEWALIRPMLNTLTASYAGDVAVLQDKLEQAFRPLGIVIVSIAQ